MDESSNLTNKEEKKKHANIKKLKYQIKTKENWKGRKKNLLKTSSKQNETKKIITNLLIITTLSLLLLLLWFECL